jgi:hypothetical protein
MLIGKRTGVAVGFSVGVGVNVGTEMFVVVAVSVNETAVFVGAAVCAIQTLIRKTIFARTSKVFFIAELLLIKRAAGGGLLPPPAAYFHFVVHI